MIWLSLIIPVITALILYFYWQHKTVWWEFIIPSAVSLILCLIFKISIEYIQTSDTEYWTGAVTVAEYYEDWDERVPCRHPKYRTVRNSDGTTYEVFDGFQHAYDVDYHPPFWQVIDSNGLTVRISQQKFIELTHKFGNNQFVELNRSYHSNDGDKYITKWDGKDETCEICTTSHRYENRITAGNSVFKFPEPTNKENLFEYPPITNYYHTAFILGFDDYQAERKLAIWNARFGKQKECRLLFLIYKDLPFDTALDQENYWQGGNKNEFIVAIGIKSNKLDWCHVISWTDEEMLKSEVKAHILRQQELNLSEIVDWTGEKVKEKFIRKRFSEFNYIAVEPPLWSIFLTFFLTAGVNVGLSIWIIQNEHE